MSFQSADYAIGDSQPVCALRQIATRRQIIDRDSDRWRNR